MSTFGERLKELRKENQLTQQDLAAKVFVSPSYISKLEKNIETPSPKLVTLLAIEFNVSTIYLVEGIEDKKLRSDLWGKRQNDSETQALLSERLSEFIDYAKKNECDIILGEHISGLVELFDILKICADATSINYSNNFLHVLNDYFSLFYSYLHNLEEDKTGEDIYEISYLMLQNFQEMVEEIRDMYTKRREATNESN